MEKCRFIRPSFKAMRKKLQIIFAAAFLGVPVALSAQNYPTLERLSQETQSLYRDVQGGLVRVQLPTPKWIRDEAAKNDPLRKWGNVLDPAVKEKIEQQQNAIVKSGELRNRMEPVIVAPSTRPSTTVDKVDVGGAWKVKSESNGEMVLEPRKTAGSALVLQAGADGNAPPANGNIGGPL